MIPDNVLLKKKEKIPWRLIEEEVVIVDLTSETVLHFNSVGKEIWCLLDGSHSIRDIVSQITAIYAVDRETAEKDTTVFLEQLLAKGLIYY